MSGGCCNGFVSSSSVAGGTGGGSASASAYAAPEQWAQNGVIAINQADVPLNAQVSTGFDDWQTLVDGSVLGFGVRFTSPITAGSATITVTINGVADATLQLVCTNVSNPSGGIALVAAGDVPYVAGDLIGFEITTNGTFAPIINDVEVSSVRIQDA
jgi:hypothetical protein